MLKSPYKLFKLKRVLSKLKLMKYYFKPTMFYQRLKGLASLSIEKKYFK